MTPLRLIAIIFIFGCTAIAWFTLGGSMQSRSGESDLRLAAEVAQLWGGQHEQAAPDAVALRPREVVQNVVENDKNGKSVTREYTSTVIDRIPLALSGSEIAVDFHLDRRQKGLLWYNTYAVRFAADYTLENPDDAARTVEVHFAFPSAQALYDDFAFTVNGKESAPPGAAANAAKAEAAGGDNELSAGLINAVELPAKGVARVHIAYASRGLGVWRYALDRRGVTQAHAFRLLMKTDFRDIDFPSGSISPTAKTAAGAGWQLEWKFASLVTGQKIGMDPPGKLNPGPLAARISFFAPVSLLFFFTVMVILGVLQGGSLHPMNYFFLAAAFFAFHLLLAYLVDHCSLHAAFLISAAVSVFLVVSYLRLVSGARFAVLKAGLAQLIFLVFFSYAFFFEGYTGLAVTIGAVLTLFVLMQLTARVDWAKVFAGDPKPRPSALPPA